MPKPVDIEIFNIAKTVVVREEVERWLKYIGVEDFEIPEDGGVSNAAMLIGLAGKRCYMSFEPGLNKNVTRIRRDYVEYFDNILASGHGCYDYETEVLTIDGWKKWDEVTYDDKLATLTKFDRGDFKARLIYEKPKKLISYWHKGQMYKIDGDYIDLLVTPDHKLFACKTTTKEGRKRNLESYELIKASNLGSISHAHYKSCDQYSGNNLEIDLQFGNILALLGFSIGDGHIDGKLRFHLRKIRKITYLKSLCHNLGIQLTSDKPDEYSLNIPDQCLDMFNNIYTLYGSERIKQIPPKILSGVNSYGALRILEGLLQSGGSYGHSGDVFDTTSEILADQFQQLCLHANLASNKMHEKYDDNSFNKKTVHRYSVMRKWFQPEVNKYSGSVAKSSFIDWEGQVYCAEMPDNTANVVYVRRNGIPVWSGNSVLEHSVFSFGIENISRVFTAEMNRHRAGWAASEGSLRFIRFDKEIPYWVPTSITGEDVLPESDLNYKVFSLQQDASDMPKEKRTTEPVDISNISLEERKQLTREVFKNAFASQEMFYSTLMRIWDMDSGDKNFDYKKKVTSCLRRIVGLGVATGGIWSGNVRALRHVMTMRCSKHAEEEMIHVFSRIAKRMQAEEPLLFGDFYQDSDGFWRPKYVKV